MPEANEAEQVAAVLEDAGIAAPPALVFDLERLLHRLAYRLAGEALHRLSLRLPRHSAAGVALARIIRGPEGESLREAARRCGASGVAVWKAEKRIRQHLRLTPPATCRNDFRDDGKKDRGGRGQKAGDRRRA
jgi:DNA-directed RNA polymerase specialized sigma24 family protein